MKRIVKTFLILLIIAGLSFSTDNSQAATLDDLQLRIMFNEVSSGQPSLYDSSQNSHPIMEGWNYADGMNATSYNDEAGYCANFIDDSQLIIQQHASLQPEDTNFTFTLGFWLYIEDAPQDSYNWLIRKRNSYEVYIRNDSISSDQLKIRFRVFWTDTYNYLLSNTILNADQWYFIVCDLNSTYTQRIWINGTIDATYAFNLPAKTEAGSTYDLVIGGVLANPTDNYFDDIFFFDTAQNDSYILWLYNNMPYMEPSESFQGIVGTETTGADFPLKGDENGRIVFQPSDDRLEDAILIGLIGIGSISSFLIGSQWRKRNRKKN